MISPRALTLQSEECTLTYRPSATLVPGWRRWTRGRPDRQASGTLTAPLPGTHGWFWENLAIKEITVTLTTAGFYNISPEFRAGAPVKNKMFQ